MCEPALVTRAAVPLAQQWWHSLAMASVFEAAGGEAGLLRLAEAWHTCVLADEVVSHAFRHGFEPDHTQRLAAYWAEALGGPRPTRACTATSRRSSGSTAAMATHDEMDRRAIACFDQALEDTGLAPDEALRTTLHDYFAWATTTTMAAYPGSPDDVPAGLPIARWSWDGPQGGNLDGSAR